MTSWKLSLLILGAISSGVRAADVPKVDFANMSYSLPVMDPGAAKGFSRVTAAKQAASIRLRSGEYKASNLDENFAFVKLKDVTYGQLLGDATPEAVVFLDLRSDATRQRGLILIYEFKAGEPKLVDQFWTGDKDHEELRNTRIKDGILHVELTGRQLKLRWDGQTFAVVQK